jgi:hypothetical protein
VKEKNRKKSHFGTREVEKSNVEESLEKSRRDKRQLSNRFKVKLIN